MKLAILFAFSVSFVQGFVGGNSGKVGSQQPSFAMVSDAMYLNIVQEIFPSFLVLISTCI